MQYVRTQDKPEVDFAKGMSPRAIALHTSENIDDYGATAGASGGFWSPISGTGSGSSGGGVDSTSGTGKQTAQST